MFAVEGGGKLAPLPALASSASTSPSPTGPRASPRPTSDPSAETRFDLRREGAAGLEKRSQAVGGRTGEGGRPAAGGAGEEEGGPGGVVGEHDVGAALGRGINDGPAVKDWAAAAAAGEEAERVGCAAMPAAAGAEEGGLPLPSASVEELVGPGGGETKKLGPEPEAGLDGLGGIEEEEEAAGGSDRAPSGGEAGEASASTAGSAEAGADTDDAAEEGGIICLSARRARGTHGTTGQSQAKRRRRWAGDVGGEGGREDEHEEVEHLVLGELELVGVGGLLGEGFETCELVRCEEGETELCLEGLDHWGGCDGEVRRSG